MKRVNAAMFAIFLLTMLVAQRNVVDAQPTISDIAICNQEAHDRTAVPASRPTTPGHRPGVESVQKSPGEPVGPAARSRATEKTDPSGSIITDSPDPLVEGMAADRSGDTAYRTAYRDCMQRRSSRAR